MQDILYLLRTNLVCRRIAWVIASIVCVAMSSFIIRLLSEATIYFFEIKPVEIRRAIVFGIHALVLLVPLFTLFSLTSVLARAFEMYVFATFVAFVSLLFSNDATGIVLSIYLIQFFAWAEVIGVYWQQKIK